MSEVEGKNEERVKTRRRRKNVKNLSSFQKINRKCDSS
jgi:hypothetical protein